MQAKRNAAKRVAWSPRWLVGGSLVVTHFAALAAATGMENQLLKSTDQSFRPVEEAAGTLSGTWAFADAHAAAAAGGGALRIRGDKAYVVDRDAQERLAADGLYRLSNGNVVKVSNGHASVRLDDHLSAKPRWKLLCVRGSWARACEAGGGPDDFDARVDVKDILASLSD